MVLTRVLNFHSNEYEYINLDNVAYIVVHDIDFHIEMICGTSIHVDKSDEAITSLISIADSA